PRIQGACLDVLRDRPTSSRASDLEAVRAEPPAPLTVDENAQWLLIKSVRGSGEVRLWDKEIRDDPELGAVVKRIDRRPEREVPVQEYLAALEGNSAEARRLEARYRSEAAEYGGRKVSLRPRERDVRRAHSSGEHERVAAARERQSYAAHRIRLRAG